MCWIALRETRKGSNVMRCNVCGITLDGAWENGGSFRVQPEFFPLGWALSESTLEPKINDTCEDCARELSIAVARRANEIAKNANINGFIDKLRKARCQWIDELKDRKIIEDKHKQLAREEFERSRGKK